MGSEAIGRYVHDNGADAGGGQVRHKHDTKRASEDRQFGNGRVPFGRAGERTATRLGGQESGDDCRESSRRAGARNGACTGCSATAAQQRRWFVHIAETQPRFPAAFDAAADRVRECRAARIDHSRKARPECSNIGRRIGDAEAIRGAGRDAAGRHGFSVRDEPTRTDASNGCGAPRRSDRRRPAYAGVRIAACR